MVYAEQWRGRYDDWAGYHSELMAPEPHSSKVLRRHAGVGLQTDAEVIVDRLHTTERGADLDDAVALVEGLRCRFLVLHGTEDRCQPIERGRRFAELSGARLLVLEGAGHLPMARHPVLVNTEIKEFVDMHTSTGATGTALALRP